MRISCGVFFFLHFCCSVALVGVRGCKIHGDTHKQRDAPGWHAVSMTIRVASFSSAFWLPRDIPGA